MVQEVIVQLDGIRFCSYSIPAVYKRFQVVVVECKLRGAAVNDRVKLPVIRLL